MSDTPARLLRLLSLLQSGREWPGSELAERLGVSPRTVRRDIDRLRDLGYPVDATMGALGGYRLVAGTAMPPLLLDDEEAVAIAVGLRTAARQPVAGIEEASLRALAKLEQVLPSRLRRRISALSTATVPTPGWAEATVDPEHLTVLAAAITGSERVRFGYRSAEGNESQRLVEPHRLVAAGRRWYLVAYDNERHDWRTFRMDRISGPRPTGVRVAARQLPATDAATFVTEKLYDLAPTYQATATLHAPKERLAPILGDTLTRVDEHTCRWHSHADTLDWLAFRLVLLGCEFTVHGPAELIDHLRALDGRISRAITA